MELRTLRSFLAVAREGNVTRAARALHITQPALSRQLLDLEHELGCELLVRESRGVALTDEGVLLRKRAQEIVELADRTEQEIRSPQAEVEGDVWIGCGESRAVELIARVAATMAAEHPGVRIRLYSGNGDDVAERIDKGLLDFGLFMGREPDNHYEHMELPWRDRWGVLMRRDHPLAQRDELVLDDLHDQRLIVSTQSPRTSGKSEPTLALFHDQGFAVCATYTLLYNASLLVEQGVGIAICFDGIVAAGEGTPFSFVPLVGTEPIPATLVWKRFAPMSRANGLFLAALREQVADWG
ncbi:MAG: LysR family transcriptional regulator [Atopobiaceae bacterium]|nr:LysR family transcriptional regulator [Atopobiaceae bacterium]